MGFNSGFKGLTNVTAKYAPLSCQSWGLSWTNEQGCVALLNCEDVTAPFCNWHSAQNFNSVSCHNCKDTDLGDSRFPQWLILRLRSFPSVAPYYLLGTRLRLKCDGTRAETRFRLSAKRTSPLKMAGASVQSNTGSRGVRISDSNAGYTMFRGSVKGTGYPLHSPVSPSLPPVNHRVPSRFNRTLPRGTEASSRCEPETIQLFPAGIHSQHSCCTDI